MAILCIVDLSEAEARSSLEVATAIAARQNDVVHALTVLPSGSDAAALAAAEAGLLSELATLSGGAGAAVHATVGTIEGVYDGVRLRSGARLVVVSPRIATETVLTSPLPIIVARPGAGFLAWARGERPLRVLIGQDDTQSSQYAIDWAGELRRSGPCELVVTQLYWPPTQFERLGLEGVRDYAEANPDVSRALERDLRARVAVLPGTGALRFRLEPHLGDVGRRLAELAKEENVDLVIVGTHHRGAVRRFFAGSVSHRLVEHATMPVACVPMGDPSARVAAVQTALVATDFSPTSKAAIPTAFGIVGAAGTVHLMHVIDGPPRNAIVEHDIFSMSSVPAVAAQREAALVEMRSLVPKGREGQARLWVIESHEPGIAIGQVAERLGVDVVCIGTHGRTGAPKALLGSVAETVLTHTRRPVVFVRRSPE